MEKLTEAILRETIEPRNPFTHKGNYGRIALIGGNQQYGGAILMATQAAVYSGAGLVTTITHPDNLTALRSRLPEAMGVDWFHQSLISSVLSQMDVVVIGPGLGTEQESLEILKIALSYKSAKQVWVIDGSAISLLAEHTSLVPKSKDGLIVYTPHQQEWSRLSNLPITEQTPENNQAAIDKIGGAVVLKKHHTEIYGFENNWLLPIGGPAMAIGGMGDTLAGMIGGFLAQFTKQQDAVLAAVYLHSYIGDTLAKQQYVVLPTQISELIPNYMKHFADL